MVSNTLFVIPAPHPDIAIIGSGGFAREVHSYLTILNVKTDFFVSDEFYKESDNVKKISELDIKKYKVLVCIADVSVRRKIVNTLPPETEYFTFIHPLAQVYSEHAIGEGSIICPNVVITSNVKIGKHVLVNLGTTIGHDAVVSDYCTINPNSSISGNCTIGTSVFVGSAAAIKEKVSIVDNTIIGMGAVVVNNITVPATYAGTPAKYLNENINILEYK